MSARWSWRLIVAAMAGLIAAGCETPPEPTEFGAQLKRERATAVPQVSGVSNEVWIKSDMAAISAAAQSAMKEAGVTIVRSSETAEGNWYLGRSLAGRQVVVEVRPAVPGSSVLRIKVEGDDSLARGLLKTLEQGTAAKPK
jgi:hypothetical protein